MPDTPLPPSLDPDKLKSFIDFAAQVRLNNARLAASQNEILNISALVAWFGAVDGLHTTIRPDGQTMEAWFDGGQLHRTDGAALVMKDAAGNVMGEQWFQHGKRYRAGGGPDVLRVNNTDEKTETRQWHDEHGRLRHELTTCPTSKAEAYKEFFYDEHGKRHRENGPACFITDARGNPCAEEWYRHGTRIEPPAGWAQSGRI